MRGHGTDVIELYLVMGVTLLLLQGAHGMVMVGVLAVAAVALSAIRRY